MMREHMEADALEAKNIKKCSIMFLNYHKTLLNCLNFVPVDLIKSHFVNGGSHNRRNHLDTPIIFVMGGGLVTQK